MQGTGTEQDPYLPTTISEFITACSSSRSYVKLTQDIDAYDDPSYVGELTTVVDISSDRLYADTPIAVKNVTVRASYMLYFGRNAAAKQYVENIHFLNWVHKKINNGSTIYWTGYTSATGNWGNYITNCKFSVKIDNGPYYPLIFDKYSDCAQYLYCKFCSFYFEYPGNMTRITDPNSMGLMTVVGFIFEYCNMIIKNLNIGALNSSGFPLLPLCRVVKTSIIFDSIKIHSNVNNNSVCLSRIVSSSTPSSKVSYSYIAFVDPIITTSSTVYNPWIYMTGSDLSSHPYENCLFATSSSNINTNTDTIVQGVTRLTLEQLKDKEYLEGIGWLP